MKKRMTTLKIIPIAKVATSSTENSIYAEDEDGYAGPNRLSDSNLNKSAPLFRAGTNFRPSRKTVDTDDENLLKNLFNNNSIKEETPSLEVSTQQQDKVSPEQDHIQQPTVTLKEDKAVQGIDNGVDNQGVEQTITELQQQFDEEKQKLMSSIDKLQKQLEQNVQQLNAATKENEHRGETINQLNEQNQELTKQLKNLESQINKINATNQDQLEKATQAIQQLQGDNQGLLDKINQVTQERDAYIQQLNELYEQLGQQNKTINQAMVTGQDNLEQTKQAYENMLNSVREKNKELASALEERLKLQQQEDTELEKEINNLMNIGHHGENGDTGDVIDEGDNTTLNVNDVTAKNDGGWLMLTLPAEHDSITITKDNLQAFATEAGGFSSIDEVQYIQVNNGDIKPILGNDLKELFSEPETVMTKVVVRNYNTIRHLTENEKKLMQTNVKGVEKKGNRLEITLIDESKSINITNEGLIFFAESAGFKNIDAVQSIRVKNCNVEPTLDKELNEIFNKPERHGNEITFERYSEDEMRELRLQRNMKGTGTTRSIAEIMDEFGVDEDTAVEIDKIATATSNAVIGKWIYVTLKGGNDTLTINNALLEYLAKQTGFRKSDNVKAIYVNNGSVIPTISDDLKDKFVIEDVDGTFYGKYKNVATRLEENEISDNVLRERGIKKLRFNKAEQAVYITMNSDVDSLYLKNQNINLLNYIESLINTDIKLVRIGHDEKELNVGGNKQIKIYLSQSPDDFCNGEVTFFVGEAVLNRQEPKMEKPSSDGNGNITVILKSDADELFEVNKEVIEYLQNQTKRYFQLRTTPLKSLTVKKSDGTAARIRVAQSIKDKYELVGGVLQAKN